MCVRARIDKDIWGTSEALDAKGVMTKEMKKAGIPVALDSPDT